MTDYLQLNDIAPESSRGKFGLLAPVPDKCKPSSGSNIGCVPVPPPPPPAPPPPPPPAQSPASTAQSLTPALTTAKQNSPISQSSSFQPALTSADGKLVVPELVRNSSMQRGNSLSTQYFEDKLAKAAEPESLYLSKAEIEKKIRDARKTMEKAAKELDFIQAAKFRDEINSLQERLKQV